MFLIFSCRNIFYLQIASKQDKPPVPAGCENYKLLTNPKRKKTHATSGDDYKCDKSGNPAISPDWQGANWYRVSPSIGTKIPTSPTKAKYCRTAATGWVIGASMPGLGQTSNAYVCFSYSKLNTCHRHVNIKIRNCRDYLLYHLPDTPDCYYGYCVE